MLYAWRRSDANRMRSRYPWGLRRDILKKDISIAIPPSIQQHSTAESRQRNEMATTLNNNTITTNVIIAGLLGTLMKMIKEQNRFSVHVPGCKEVL